MMEQDTLPATNSQLIDIRTNVMVQVVLLGVIIGAVTWLAALLIERFITSALMCGGSGVSCDSSVLVAGNVALVLTAIGGLLGLVRLSVYRPLLIVIAASIVLWGISGYVVGMQWYEAMAWVIILYAVTYAAFTWLVRPRLFLFAIILVLAVVAAARLLPVFL